MDAAWSHNKAQKPKSLMNNQKPIASLSLDLDNQWSYMKTHGDTGWQDFPSYLEIVVPRALEFLKKQNLRITFFIVGQDAALEKNHAAIRAIAEAGHEIGNHSFCHEPWLHRYAKTQIENDISLAEEKIVEVTGQQPKGFRGPGYSLSESALLVLARRGYIYDASTLPTFIGPLARKYYFMKSRLSDEEKEKKELLFGSWQDGLRPIHPYRWRFAGDNGPVDGLLEIPVTTMPFFRIPIHMSYLLYLASFSHQLARVYFKAALLLCRITGTHPSLLLHPLDFLGCDDLKDLSFFPAMSTTHDQKMQLVAEMIIQFEGQYRVVTLLEHALAAAQLARLQSIKPRFSSPSPRN
jgi:hypothetical protein